MIMLPFFITILLPIIFALVGADSVTENVTLYTDIRLVNTSDSLKRLKALPIVYYKFLYDSIPDRIQLGVIGPEAQRLFPESIDVLPSTAFITSGGSRDTNSNNNTKSHQPVTVTNFPVVDKNVLYMHGLAAVQELIAQVGFLKGALHNLENHSGEYKREFETLQLVINSEADHQLKDQLELLRLEYANKQEELTLDERRKQREREKMLLQLEEEKKLLEYEESLSKERLFQQEQITRGNLEKQLQLEKDLTERKELLQKQSTNLQQSLRANHTQELETKKLQFEKEKIRIEMEAKMNQEKLNEEITIRKLQTQSKLDTERMIETIQNISTQIIMIFRNIFAHPKQLLMIAGLILLLVFGYFLIKELSNLIRQFIQSNIGKPLLVRETSYHWSLFPDLAGLWKWLLLENKEKYISSTLKALEREFAHIILSRDDKERVINLALATKNTKQSGAPYRHVLLHGPPGTGKTLIARKLAACSGMDYAILSGGDVAPLGEDAVTQLHALFRWAKKSSKGLLVFIDEAEAFLSSRNHIFGETGASDTHIRNALNALLYQTGTPSTHFMMILATNRPEDLDSAILDRIDVSIQISLPKLPERVELIKLYANLHLTQLIEQKTVKNFLLRSLRQLFKMELCPYSIEARCFEEETIHFISQQIEGFSGREISKLFISIQYGLVLSSNGQLTWKLVREIIKNKLLEHHIKNSGFQDHLQFNLELFDRNDPIGHKGGEETKGQRTEEVMLATSRIEKERLPQEQQQQQQEQLQDQSGNKGNKTKKLSNKK